MELAACIGITSAVQTRQPKRAERPRQMEMTFDFTERSLLCTVTRWDHKSGMLASQWQSRDVPLFHSCVIAIEISWLYL